MANDKIPLVAVGDRDTFGSAKEQAAYQEFGQDVTYVPGYSDVRRENAAKQVRRERGTPVRARLQWVRAQTSSGKPDGRDIASWQAKGYQFVTKDNIGSLGFEAPPSGQLDAATGRFLLGDTVLMYCPATVAARNENVLRRATDERSSADASASDLHAEGRKLGQQVGQSDLTEATVKSTMEVRKA